MSQKIIFEIQADICHRMSNPIRIEIVHVLREGPMRVSEIVRLTGHQQTKVSRHLSVLRQGGIVSSERVGQEIIYQIANPKIVSICDLMREFLIEETSRRSNLVDDSLNEPQV
jgi:DNA-binding transcriptional ArsR family regulator